MIEVWVVKKDVINPFRDKRTNPRRDVNDWPVFKAGLRFYVNSDGPVTLIQVPGSYHGIGNFKKSHPKSAALFKLILDNSEKVEATNEEWVDINNVHVRSLFFKFMDLGVITRDMIVQTVELEKLRLKALTGLTEESND